MTDSRPLSPSPAYSAESDNATSQPESHGAAQHAFLPLVLSSDISDTSGANPPSSYTSSPQSPPLLADQTDGDLGRYSRPHVAISMTDRGFARDMRTETGQAVVTSLTTCSIHANASRLVATSIGNARTTSGASDNVKADKPTTFMRKETSSSAAIAWVERPAADTRRSSHGSNGSMLELDSLPNEVLMHVLSFLDVCDLLATSRVGCWFLFFYVSQDGCDWWRGRFVRPPPIRVFRSPSISHIFVHVSYPLSCARGSCTTLWRVPLTAVPPYAT